MCQCDGDSNNVKSVLFDNPVFGNTSQNRAFTLIVDIFEEWILTAQSQRLGHFVSVKTNVSTYYLSYYYQKFPSCFSIFNLCLLYKQSLFSSKLSISVPQGCRSLFLRAKYVFRYRAPSASLGRPSMDVHSVRWGFPTVSPHVVWAKVTPVSRTRSRKRKYE